MYFNRALTFTLFVCLLSLVLSNQVAAEEWNTDTYIDLVDRAEEAAEQAEFLHSLDSADRTDDTAETIRELLIQSASLKEEALEMLQSALSGGVFSGDESIHQQAQSDLYLLYDNVMAALLALDFCQSTLNRLEQAIELGENAVIPQSMSSELETGFTQRIDSCFQRTAVSQETTDATDLQAPAPSSTTEESSILPWILIGTGGAFVIGGIAYDLSLSSEQDEFDTLKATCREGCTNSEISRAEDLQSTLDTGKAIVGTMIAAGLVSAIVGTVLIFTEEDAVDDRQIALSPNRSFDGFTIQYSTPF